MTVAQIAATEDLFSALALPISSQAFEELNEVQLIVNDLNVEHTVTDTRIFPWGNNSYTSAKFYKFIFGAIPEDPALKAIWKSKCLPKLRVFAWLLLMDRLNTKELMQRKNWQIEGGLFCVLCSHHFEESRDHLFFQCPFAHSCWEKINIQWDNSLEISSRFTQARQAFRGPCFIEIAICAAWNIWKERNGFIFRNEAPSLARWEVRFKSDLSLHQYRVKVALVQPLLDWIFSFII
jgi:hypothetical protein